MESRSTKIGIHHIDSHESGVGSFLVIRLFNKSTALNSEVPSLHVDKYITIFELLMKIHSFVLIEI